MTPAFSDLIARLKSAGAITTADVMALRAQVYGADDVTPDAIDALADLDRSIGQPAPEWGELFAEAMVDFVVRQEDPRDYVDETKANWLMRVFAADPLSEAAMEALVRVLDTADGAPIALETFALGKLKSAVVAARAVRAGDVARLRRLVFSGSGEDNVGVTRHEADQLFDIDDACRGAENDPAWPDFFAKAISASLTSVSPFHVHSRDEAAKDEAWLTERESAFSFLGKMAHAPDLGGSLRELRDRYGEMSQEWTKPEADMEAAEAAAGPIDEQEGRWLLARLGDGAPTDAGRRLIRLVTAEAPQFSDTLARLMDKASGAIPPKDQPAVFGRRAS